VSLRSDRQRGGSTPQELDLQAGVAFEFADVEAMSWSERPAPRRR